MRTEYGSGDVLTMTLMEKLILLSAVKFATLDAYGMGIEMEGGKPGWYDALNGMPGLFRFFHGGDLRAGAHALLHHRGLKSNIREKSHS